MFQSKTFRTKYIFIWLIAVLIVYVFVNNILFIAWSAAKREQPTDDKHSNPIGILYRDQLDFIKRRIEVLESDLDRSNKNARRLSEMMTNFNHQVDDQKSFDANNQVRIAVLVFVCNRPSALEEHLSQLIARRKESGFGKDQFPIIVSQDCNHKETGKMIEKHSSELFAHLKQPDQSDISVDQNGQPVAVHLRGYFKIARHYKWALEQVFMKHAFQSVIITEDDLMIATDFFDYFKAMHDVLVRDPTLFCVSAWNDNGKEQLINLNRADKVYRSDFFPGLGWMMGRSLWIELRKKWPKGFWDDWLRESGQRKNRACIRPEISRTGMDINSAKNGVSNGQFFDTHLKLIVMNERRVNWLERDNDHLLQSNYDKTFLHNVYNKSIELNDLTDLMNKMESNENNRVSYLLTYKTKSDFLRFADHFGMMNDFKNGVPRTAYKGIVSIFYQQTNIYIAPSDKYDWQGYDPTW